MLMISTTLELDPDREGYKKAVIHRLERAAKEHLAQFPDVAGFVLINRPKDWRRPAA